MREKGPRLSPGDQDLAAAPGGDLSKQKCCLGTVGEEGRMADYSPSWQHRGTNCGLFHQISLFLLLLL